MLASYSWLNKYAECRLPVEKTAELLTGLGLEVKHIRRINSPIQNLTTGKILSITKHPKADKLSLVTVDTPANQLTVVCGAGNIHPDAMVIIAHEGAELPCGITIKKTVIRGVESCAMICSKAELGLEKKSNGVWLLPDNTALTADPNTIIGEEDHIFDIDLTANRGDCQSILGIAAELSIITGKKILLPEEPEHMGKTGNIDIKVENSTACPRYTGRLIKGITVGPSPDWLKNRLEAHDIRSISNIVDITNYVMLECGHPLHAFDYNKLEGQCVRVRNANPGETIQTLDSQYHITLSEEDLVICDNKQPIALAGIIGGAGSGIDENTKDIIIESAYFNPSHIRRTSKRHKIRTDSSIRFEKGIDIHHVRHALARAVNLIIECAGGTISSSIKDIYPKKFPEQTVMLRFSAVKKIIGIKLDKTQLHDIISSAGFRIKYSDTDKMQLIVPTGRNDIHEECDVIEEIARIYGYDNIPQTMPFIKNTDFAIQSAGTVRAEDIACGLGYNEVKNVSFTERACLEACGVDTSLCVKVNNPLSPEFTFLRNTLLFGMMRNLRCNNEHYRNYENKYFETGKFFLQEGNEPSEIQSLGFLCSGESTEPNWTTTTRVMNYYDLSGEVSEYFIKYGHPEISIMPGTSPLLSGSANGIISINGIKVGIIGEVSRKITAYFDTTIQPVYFAEINLDILSGISRRSDVYTPPSPYPSAKRDLAFLIPEAVAISDVHTKLRTISPLAENIRILSIYQGGNIPAGMQSAAFSIDFSSHEKTLTKEEADTEQQKMIEGICAEFPGSKLR